MQMRQRMLDFLNEYRNDFITVARFAECHGLRVEECAALIRLAREIESHAHPDA